MIHLNIDRQKGLLVNKYNEIFKKTRYHSNNLLLQCIVVGTSAMN